MRCRYKVAPVASDQTADALFRELDERIEAAMVRYHVPGVAVGVFWQGREHLKGFGVTNVDHPLPVDAETLFRIGSTTKTFTATAMMRLVEQGKVDLAAQPADICRTSSSPTKPPPLASRCGNC